MIKKGLLLSTAAQRLLMLHLDAIAVVAEVIGQGADKRKHMTSPGGVALGCDPCASGYLVAYP